jgi:L-threonylcarbamoyladenylate synthase
MLVVRDPKNDSPELGYVRKALEQGQLAVVPTDTVYGIAALAESEEAVGRLYAAKGRPANQPTAVVFANVAALRETFPKLSPRASWAVSALLPGPWTLIVENPDGQLPWLTGGEPGPIGLRVPVGALDLPPIAASSANEAGQPTIAKVAELPPSLQDHIACVIDRGDLGGPGHLPSTVIDLTPWEAGAGEPRIVRDDAGRGAQAVVLLNGAPAA